MLTTAIHAGTAYTVGVAMLTFTNASTLLAFGCAAGIAVLKRLLF